MEFALD